MELQSKLARWPATQREIEEPEAAHWLMSTSRGVQASVEDVQRGTPVVVVVQARPVAAQS